MAIQKVRQYGNRVIPTLKDKVEFVDIINDVTTGGTAVPLSAEMGKTLKSNVNQEITDRGQAIIDLKGGVSVTNATLGKIEINLNQEIQDRKGGDIDARYAAQTGITSEKDRAEAAELVLRNDLATEVINRDGAVVAEGNRAKLAEGVLQDNINTVESNYKASDITLTEKVDSDIASEKLARETEDLRLDSKIDTEIADRKSAISKEISDRDTAISLETTRATGAESTLGVALDNETLRANNSETALGGRIDTVIDTVSNNKSSIDTALATEVSDRISADNAHSSRLTAIEGGLVAGVIWKGSVTTLADIDALVEADLESGWAFYVSDEKDVYVVLPDNGGDYVPSTFTNKSFLKIADFKELTGLVTAEKNRAQNAESVLTSAISSEVSSRENEITRTEGLISAEVSTRKSEVTRVEAVIAANLATHTSELNSEKERSIAADTVLQGNINAVENGYKDADVAMTTAYRAADTAMETAYKAADTVLQGKLDSAIAVSAKAVADETARAKASEAVIVDSVTQEVADRKAEVLVEKERAIAAEGILTDNLATETANRITAVDTENSRATSAESALDLRLDVIEGDKTTIGSVAKAEYDSKVYADKWMPMIKLEGANGQLSVVGDTITVSYAPMNDGVIMGEVVVYGGDNDSEAIAVSVSNITGTSITLDVVTAGEFDGKNCKVQYMFREGDQVGAGMGVAGENGAGN